MFCSDEIYKKIFITKNSSVTFYKYMGIIQSKSYITCVLIFSCILYILTFINWFVTLKTLPQNKHTIPEACAAINRHFSMGFRDHRNFQHPKLIKRWNVEIVTRYC